MDGIVDEQDFAATWGKQGIMEYRAQAWDGLLSVDGVAQLFDAPNVVGGLLADFGEGLVSILTGVNMGPVLLTVTTPSVPGPAQPADWEDIAEASIEADDSGLAGMVVVGPEDELPTEDARLDAQGAGWYRLRVSARGRDIAYDLVTDEPVEHYLIEAWPQAPSPPSVFKASSRQSQQPGGPIPQGGVRVT